MRGGGSALAGYLKRLRLTSPAEMPHRVAELWRLRRLRRQYNRGSRSTGLVEPDRFEFCSLELRAGSLPIPPECLPNLEFVGIRVASIVR
jgi:hypothetical protein